MLFQLRPAHRKIALAFGLVSMLAAGGCAEIIPASPEQIDQLAEKRADLEEAKALVEYQKQRKKEVQLEGIDPDSLDNVEPLKLEPRWQTFKVKSRENKLKAAKEQFQGLAANVVSKCQLEAKDADDLDKCVKQIPEATYDPIKVLAGAVAAAIAALGLLLTFRFVRKRTDPVAQAGEQLRLAVTTSQKNTVCTGEHGGFSIKVETSASRGGEGDRFIRVLILSKIDPNVVVRFGPLAPPTGLDLPDLEAPEVPDRRLPEGYKLRLSQGSSADDLLQGDLGFQLSSYDPIDVRVHDGLCGVTCWQSRRPRSRSLNLLTWPCRSPACTPPTGAEFAAPEHPADVVAAGRLCRIGGRADGVGRTGRLFARPV